MKPPAAHRSLSMKMLRATLAALLLLSVIPALAETAATASAPGSPSLDRRPLGAGATIYVRMVKGKRWVGIDASQRLAAGVAKADRAAFVVEKIAGGVSPNLLPGDVVRVRTDASDKGVGVGSSDELVVGGPMARFVVDRARAKKGNPGLKIGEPIVLHLEGSSQWVGLDRATSLLTSTAFSPDAFVIRSR